MSFIKRHWRGDLPLGISVVVVLIGLSLAYHLALPWFVAQFYNRPPLYIGITTLYVLLTCFIIFPWQLRGVFRSLDRHFLKYENYLVLYGVQAIAIAGLILTVSMVIGNAQTLVYYWEKKAFEKNNDILNYSLSLSSDGKILQLNGLLDFGITASTAKFLAQYPGITAVELNSIGGQIYEGRGLANLFQQYSLHTYALNQCSSSCTTAFIGGTQRYLGRNAKLGFHQYAIDQNRRGQTTAVYDLQREQEKDIAFFKSQGIEEAFLNRVFDTPQHSMWYPENQLLIDSGVIDALVK